MSERLRGRGISVSAAGGYLERRRMLKLGGTGLLGGLSLPLLAEIDEDEGDESSEEEEEEEGGQQEEVAEEPKKRGKRQKRG